MYDYEGDGMGWDGVRGKVGVGIDMYILLYLFIVSQVEGGWCSGTRGMWIKRGMHEWCLLYE